MLKQNMKVTDQTEREPTVAVAEGEETDGTVPITTL